MGVGVGHGPAQDDLFDGGVLQLLPQGVGQSGQRLLAGGQDPFENAQRKLALQLFADLFDRSGLLEQSAGDQAALAGVGFWGYQLFEDGQLRLGVSPQSLFQQRGLLGAIVVGP